MLDVLFVRLPADAGENLSRVPLAALHHETGEALVRFYLRRSGFAHPGAFPRGAHGKPLLAGRDDLFFNISHSGALVVAAFSDREIGVDVERHGRTRLEVASRFFHAEEYEMLRAAGEGARAELFTDLWAIKESFIKCLGMGFSRPLSTFRVDLSGGRVALYREAARLPVHVSRCEIAPGYSCFTCGEVPDLPRVEELPYAEI
jgi:4'-phosphopantetheinyl transferase